MGVYRLACLFCKPAPNPDHLGSQCGWHCPGTAASVSRLLFFANFAFSIKTGGFEGEQAPDLRWDSTALMFPAWEEGVFSTAYHSFRIHLEVVQRMPGKGESHGPRPMSQGCPLWLATLDLLRSVEQAKWPDWASGLCV